MDSPAETDRTAVPKPLGPLGRDEMNLAEFPITLLTDRVSKDQKEAVYQDEIYDERSGRTLARRLTIQAGNYGLTTAIDDEVILALIQLTKQKNHFTNRRVEFSRHELVQLLGWSIGGASYDRVLLSLQRWTSVYLQYENAWRDNRAKAWTTKGFHIIDSFEFNDSRLASDQLDLAPSHIVWNEVIFESFQAGYLKPLDYDLCTGLSNSTAKRMFRFLDKRFYHKPDWTFELKEFAHEHIGLSRNYEGPAHLKRKLQPAIAELERVGFLEPLPAAERFPKSDGRWGVRFLHRTNPPPAAPGPGVPPASAGPPPDLVAALIRRGVTPKTAAQLQRYPAERIALKIEVFDWLVAKNDKRVAQSPAGYLVKSIEDDYAAPKCFESRAERQRKEAARQTAAQRDAEEHRRKAEEAARARAEDEAVRAYRASLTPEQLRQLEAEALARASAETRQTYETTPHARFQESLLFSLTNDHIRWLLRAGTLPVPPP
jgi:Replication initiator protein A